MRMLVIWGAAVCLAASMSSTAVFGQAHFMAELDALQEVPAGPEVGQGTASFTLIGSELYYSLTVESLSGPIVAAHIHSARRGVAGAVAFDLSGDFFGPIDASTSTAHGVVSGLTTTDIGTLLSSGFYLNIHTAAHPGGELRGQIDIAGGVHLSADMTGSQENPPVAVAGTGTGSFSLTAEGLQIDVTATGLTGPITAAHIHSGETGVSGGFVLNLASAVVGNHIETFWARGAAGLTDTLLRELLAGRLYVNLHTAAHPGGEIRGQIQVASGFGFHAKADGTQETPPVATGAEGTAAFSLTPAGLVFDLTHSGLASAVVGAHFHHAAAGSNGPVVRDILADFTGSSAYGIWSPEDSQPLTPELICALLEGEIYVNIHTMAHPGGEIRGQLVLNTDRTSLTATMSGFEEQPPSGAGGRGTAAFRMGGAGLEYDITVDGLTGGVTAAHVHRGGIGVNGPVVYTVTAAFGGGNHGRGTIVAPSVAEIKDLLRGNFYINVHTAANPGGELRGQIELSSGVGFSFPLTGSQENPAIVTNGVGSGSASLTREGLVLAATVDNLNGAFVAAHLHGATTGVNGGVVRDLSGSFSANHMEDVWTAADSSPLTSLLIDELLVGHIYANVHTAASPGGEIRGQLLYNEGFFGDAELLGGNEVPGVSTSGMGTGVFRVSENALVYGISFDNLEGAFTASHFHNAPPGSNGAVVFDITASYSANSARGSWRSTSAPGLGTADVCDFLSGELYVNVHSSMFPGGEIRGNLFELVPAGIEPAEAIRTEITLRAYPNPSRGGAVVSFDLATAQHVQLTLHGADGARVTTIVEGRLPAGAQLFGLADQDLASGVYFVQLNAERGQSSTKWIVVE